MLRGRKKCKDKQPMDKKQLNPYEKAQKNEQDALVLQYLPAVRAMAYRLKERLPSSIDVNDLISLGTEEMIKLSRRYKSDQNDSFWGYGRKRVYGAMLDFLRSLDVMSRSNRKLVKAMDIEIDKYFNSHGEEPSEEYLSEVLNEDLEKVRTARNAHMIATTLPINEQINMFAGEQTEDIIEKEDLVEHVKVILQSFDERQQLIIQLYYFEELSLKEISSMLDISESRISQIHKTLIHKIRQSLGA